MEDLAYLGNRIHCGLVVITREFSPSFDSNYGFFPRCHVDAFHPGLTGALVWDIMNAEHTTLLLGSKVGHIIESELNCSPIAITFA